ncbi:MAG: hypothetical protein R8P61_23525 [Bacteroidia bacterium]|nr:hypothetical protein [Bacteroidia bacterium]
MTRKLSTILILLIFFITEGYSQRKKDRNDFSGNIGRLYLKTGLSNLLHPTAPSMDVGIGIMFSENLGLDLLYGFRSPQLNYASFENRIQFDTYQKFFTSLRYFYGRRGIAEPLSFGPAFISLEGYYSKGETEARDNFALSNEADTKLDYISADIEKEAIAAHVKAGTIFQLTKRLELEASSGIGLISFNRKYLVIQNPIITQQGLFEDLIGPYDDRNIGRTDYINLIVQIRLNYQLL